MSILTDEEIETLQASNATLVDENAKQAERIAELERRNSILQSYVPVKGKNNTEEYDLDDIKRRMFKNGN